MEWLNNYSKNIQDNINKINKINNLNTGEKDEDYLRGVANTLKMKEDLDKLIDNTEDNDTTGDVVAKGGKPTKPTKPTITGKKEILGKQRCIYKKVGDRKEYVKYKGDLITVKDYKKIISVKK